MDADDAHGMDRAKGISIGADRLPLSLMDTVEHGDQWYSLHFRSATDACGSPTELCVYV